MLRRHTYAIHQLYFSPSFLIDFLSRFVCSTFICRRVDNFDKHSDVFSSAASFFMQLFQFAAKRASKKNTHSFLLVTFLCYFNIFYAQFSCTDAYLTHCCDPSMCKIFIFIPNELWQIKPQMHKSPSEISGSNPMRKKKVSHQYGIKFISMASRLTANAFDCSSQRHRISMQLICIQLKMISCWKPIKQPAMINASQPM